ncbi:MULTISPECIES: hypothetical protein [Halorussus]|uniref:hypothetical protein n=1 Tax=Halorussus TaxID=1070314 RepID=UPI00209EDC81|nr:hypothetical protein [Halorussus vallis]USZ74479.1 hypothetical protein NGM07_13615 [Halorussus vallis]
MRGRLDVPDVVDTLIQHTFGNSFGATANAPLSGGGSISLSVELVVAVSVVAIVSVSLAWLLGRNQTKN